MSGPYRVLCAHVVLGDEPQVWREERDLPGRFARVLPCPDCCAGGRPVPFTPPAGFDGGLLWVHDETCPAAQNVTRRGAA